MYNFVRRPHFVCFLLLSVLWVPGLSSCVMQTHQVALDMAKEYDAIVILHDAVYQKGYRFYVQGVQTTVRRSGRMPMRGTFMSELGTHPEITGEYTILPGAPRKTVYCAFRMRYGKAPFAPSYYARLNSKNLPVYDAPTWTGAGDRKAKGWWPYRNAKGEIVAWYEPEIDNYHSRRYDEVWRESLPAGARPVRLTAEEIANHPVLKGEAGVPKILLRERSAPRVDGTRAVFAYPLAGVCWVVPDAPVTLASHVLTLPLWIMLWVL